METVFTQEKEFEEAFIKVLSEKGWEKEVLKNYTEAQLIKNWANILFNNNRGKDRLNDYPLTDGEMGQILEQIKSLKTPLKINGFINGFSVIITRDNPEDKEHFGKEVSLKIYDSREIAAGQSRYQIVQQPKFPTKSEILNNRRGDIMLLINGMPVIHIELKKSGIPISQACCQIEKYSAEGVFTGLFSLVQIFVAMNPEDSVYFANPGPEGKFNPNYYFHWADYNNEPIKKWDQVASTLLSIPMAHQMIGFYTVADNTDGVLKVMRSYQYYAASKISDTVAQQKWENKAQLGGYIWHTTGSGKTMTSFKSAQLIASSKDADKVIFLMDRIELGTQSLREYRNFAGDSEDVQATENTGVLVTKLKSINPADTLIVTSIQKMSNIKDENEGGFKTADIEQMNSKRIVFIIDECHRSTFGNMLRTIKDTFPKALFFGFTGTPIHDENQKKDSTTSTVFGNELHRYSIADGIRDKNVLGFDPYKVLTYQDEDLRQAVALEKAKAHTLEEALDDPEKKKVYYEYMNRPMAGCYVATDRYEKGIEDYLPNCQYNCNEHRESVVKDILKNQRTLSHKGKFHAIFATSSIPEAILYYRLLKNKAPQLKITALFDPNIDNNGTGITKEKGLFEIITDYNNRYGTDFKIPTFAKMKKDIAARLAHKKPYEHIEREPNQQIDLLIVVDQMLTGFDSKWINTLYLDKLLEYENIIQAFSRTNRLFGPEKPFGTIRYYRRPHTMEKQIEEAVKLYSGDKPLGLFVQKLDKNLEQINFLYNQIQELFENAEIENFAKLPSENRDRERFVNLFNALQSILEAALVQGFSWKNNNIDVQLNEENYKTLILRYKELSYKSEIDDDTNDNDDNHDIPYEIKGYITSIDTGVINSDYMNSRFEKYLKLLKQKDSIAEEQIQQAINELHKTFASLPAEEQKAAMIFLHNIQSGDIIPDGEKTLQDYINEYMVNNKNDQIHHFALTFGIKEDMLREMMSHKITESNINEYGRFNALKSTADRKKAKEYFEKKEGQSIIPPKVANKLDNLLRKFILSGGFELEKDNIQ